MTESGGVTTQSGIFYQNSVAALALADLLELTQQPPRDRVVEVRVEAPGHVDDIVIRYADGHRVFQNIKTDVSPGNQPWGRLWQSLQRQASQPDFREEDQLNVVFDEASAVARRLRDMCDRASSSVNNAEWRSRLTKDHERLLSSIESIVGTSDDVFELLRRTTVKILPLEQIEDEFARRRLGGGLTLPTTLLSILRDIAGGGARKRALFLSAPLRRRLLADHNVAISAPAEWGLLAYRSAITRLARIEIPGTRVSGTVDDLFIWPRTRIYERTCLSDFEDEQQFRAEEAQIDISAFPSDHLNHCVIVAGPGYGKSALLTAISGRLAQSAYVPVVIPLASLASSEAGIIEFLTSQINSTFDIRADWSGLAEQGLLVLLFDGLDEIPSGVRPILLGRIATFSARYPLSPWMLTVRDATAFSGATDAQFIEILSLEDTDIERYAETMKRRLPSLDVWKFVNRLGMYPDLARLARIPLFLSMLLVTVESVDELPTTRSDLIEAYLKTVFAPHEHKIVSGPHDKAVQLRSIAEALAFERLERQEIGASEREVREIIARIAENPRDVETLFQRLRANGILRQQSSIRLQFPFPIVQEYLAACYLVRHLPDTLINRFDDAVQRPWAQVIQFSLELHPDPAPIVRAMLSRTDDAFSTGLRLVGRCIANGARVDQATKTEVGDRLVAFWIGAPTQARERTGRLLADAFSNPMSPSLRSALHHYWLLNDGGGEMISKASDISLTMSVLSSLMEHSQSRGFFMYHSVRPAISKAGDVAFKAIVARIEQDECAETHAEGFDSLLAHFDSGSVSRDLAIALAMDEKKPRKVRLQAFRISGSPLVPDALELVNEWLGSEALKDDWITPRLIGLHPNRETLLFEALSNELIPFGRREYLATHMAQILPNERERIEFINRCLAQPNFHSELAAILRIFAARHGDKAEFESLINQISQHSVSIVGHILSLSGHFPDRELAERAANLVQIKVNNGKDAAVLAGSVTIGMLYVFEMDFAFGGALRNGHPHPGIVCWAELLEDWSVRTDLTELEQLTLLTAASRLGSRHAGRRLSTLVHALTNPDDPKYAEDDYGHTITTAIREVRRHEPLLPLTLAESFVRAAKPNLPIAGVGVIEAHSNLTALNLMIKLHREISEWYLRDMLANSIESLAAKLGVVVQRSDKFLQIVP